MVLYAGIDEAWDLSPLFKEHITKLDNINSCSNQENFEQEHKQQEQKQENYRIRVPRNYYNQEPRYYREPPIVVVHDDYVEHSKTCKLCNKYLSPQTTEIIIIVLICLIILFVLDLFFKLNIRL